MNIFYLDKDPVQAATMMCDKHVVKMPLESAQMLCTNHRVVDDVDSLHNIPLYKIAHKNHPSTIWARQSKENYLWLYDHFVALCDEYTHRYGKRHLCDTKYSVVLSEPPINLPDGSFTEPPQCMPDYCKIEGDSITSYRQYYMNEKHTIAVWKDESRKPIWYEVK